MMYIVEFLKEDSKYRMFGVKKTEDDTHFISPRGNKFDNPRFVREYCVIRAKEVVKIIENKVGHFDLDRPLEMIGASIETVLEVAEQEKPIRRIYKLFNRGT